MVDEPSNGAYYGSIVAAPYGKAIFSGLFDYLNEPKQDETVSVEFVTMPDLTNLPLAEAAKQVVNLGLYYEVDGEGDIVTGQLPPVGTMIQKGTTIVLIT